MNRCIPPSKDSAAGGNGSHLGEAPSLSLSEKHAFEPCR